MPRQRYRAFISYSHANRRWADWLFSRIESYRVPRVLVDTERGGAIIPGRIRPLFKDRDELASAADRSSQVESALSASDALIVVCSPAARASQWVDQEIRYFKSLGRADRVFPIIVDGNEATAFPSALTQSVDAAGNVTGDAPEPLAADIYPDRDGKQTAALKIIAGLLSVSFDELKRRDLAQQYRRLSVFTAAASGLIVVMSVLAWTAFVAEREAGLRSAQAEDLVEFMIVDLRTRLEPIGRLDVLDEVGAKA
jgi:hypothetical protein